MIDAGPKFYVVWSPTPYNHDFKVKVMDSEFLYWSFVFKFLQCLFLCFMFCMVIEIGPKFFLYGTIPNPVHDLSVMLTDLKFLYKSFVINFLHFQVFGKPSMDFIHLWHDDRALSKILCSAIPIPGWRSRSQTEFFAWNCYSVIFCKAFDWFESCLVWMDIRF